jgi:hypothetical protein
LITFGEGAGEVAAFDECSTDPCTDALHRCEQHEVGDLPRPWVCSDANHYWLGDFTCACAYDAATTQYDQAVLAGCGAGSVLQLRDGTPYSNYELSGWLRSAPTFRSMLCNAVFGRMTTVGQCVPVL